MPIQISIIDEETHYKNWFKGMWLDLYGQPTAPANKANLKKFEDTHGVKFGRYADWKSSHAVHYLEVEDESAAVMFMLKWP